MNTPLVNGKMRVFLSDVMFDVERDGKGGRVSIPFGRQDCTVFRKVMSTEDTIHEFAPTLRTEAQARAFRVALQTLGDLCGFGINYFDLENVGYVKTATEVSADNSALMRNIRRHEHALEGAIAGICRAVMAASRSVVSTSTRSPQLPGALATGSAAVASTVTGGILPFLLAFHSSKRRKSQDIRYISNIIQASTPIIMPIDTPERAKLSPIEMDSTAANIIYPPSKAR